MTKRGRYGSGSIYQRGRIFHVSYREVKRLPGGTPKYIQHRESTHSEDREYALKFLNRKLMEIGGRRPTLVDPQKVSYEDLRENFLARCVEKKLRSLKHTKDGTVTLATLPRLDKAFTGWKASEITTAHVRRFREEGKRDGLSDARLNRYTATLRAMFRQAAKDELITRTEMPAYFPTVAEPNEARGAIYIKDEWYKPLRQHLKEPLRSAFTLAYHTGIRVHEMWRLCWRNIDIKTRVVTLPGEITKTGKLRLVFLPADFTLPPGEPDDLVFPVGSYRKPWQKACVAIGAAHWQETSTGYKKYVGPLLRHTRHTAVRNMSDAGQPEARIMAISGHVTRSTFDRYNLKRKEDVEIMRKAIERQHRKRQRRN